MPGGQPLRQTHGSGIEFAPDDGVLVGAEFRLQEAAWIEGVTTMARAGVRVIVDEAACLLP